MTVKEIMYGRWEQAKKTIPTNTDDSLANYLLDLYFNGLLSPSCEPSSPICHVCFQVASKVAAKLTSPLVFSIPQVHLGLHWMCADLQGHFPLH